MTGHPFAVNWITNLLEPCTGPDVPSSDNDLSTTMYPGPGQVTVICVKTLVPKPEVVQSSCVPKETFEIQ